MSKGRLRVKSQNLLDGDLVFVSHRWRSVVRVVITKTLVSVRFRNKLVRFKKDTFVEIRQ